MERQLLLIHGCSLYVTAKLVAYKVNRRHIGNIDRRQINSGRRWIAVPGDGAAYFKQELTFYRCISQVVGTLVNSISACKVDLAARIDRKIQLRITLDPDHIAVAIINDDSKRSFFVNPDIGRH